MSCTTQQCQLTHTRTLNIRSVIPILMLILVSVANSYWILCIMHHSSSGATTVATTLRCSFSCQRKMRVIMHRRRFISSLCSYPLFWRPFTSYLLSLCSNWSMHCKCFECCKRLTQPKTNTAQTNKQTKQNWESHFNWQPKNNTNAITEENKSSNWRIIAAVVVGPNMNEYFIEYCVCSVCKMIGSSYHHLPSPSGHHWLPLAIEAVAGKPRRPQLTGNHLNWPQMTTPATV